MTEQCKANMEHSYQEGSCKCCGNVHKQECGEHSCKWPEMLLKLADEAWMEVLKEKMKAEVEKNEGGELERLAQIVGKANGEKWNHKVKAKENCEDYKNTIKEFFKST